VGFADLPAGSQGLADPMWPSNPLLAEMAEELLATIAENATSLRIDRGKRAA